MLAQRDVGVSRESKPPRAGEEFAFQAFHRGGAQSAFVDPGGAFGLRKAEPVQFADDLATNCHAAGIVEHHIHVVAGELAHQHRRAPVDKALRQPLVQRIRQPVLHGARHVLPMHTVVDPVRTVCGIGPGTDLRQRDIAFGEVEPRDLRSKPVFRQHAGLADQVQEDRTHQPHMFFGTELVEIRQLAGVPQQAHLRGGARLVANLIQFAQNP